MSDLTFVCEKSIWLSYITSVDFCSKFRYRQRKPSNFKCKKKIKDRAKWLSSSVKNRNSKARLNFKNSKQNKLARMFCFVSFFLSLLLFIFAFCQLNLKLYIYYNELCGTEIVWASSGDVYFINKNSVIKGQCFYVIRIPFQFWFVECMCNRLQWNCYNYDTRSGATETEYWKGNTHNLFSWWCEWSE